MSEGDVQRVIDALAGSLSGDQGTRENASKVLMEVRANEKSLKGR